MIKAKMFFLLLPLIFIACNSSDSNDAEDKPVSSLYPDEVQSLFTQVNQHPDSISLRLKLAIALDSIGVYKEALQQADKLIKKDTANFEIWYTHGQIAEDAGDTLKAMQSYGRALQLYPSADVMLNMANLYAEQKNRRALVICNEVKQLGLGREYDAHCSFIAGVYNARTGNGSNAITLFDQCIADNYTYMPAYIEKGLVYFDKKQYEQALKVFQFASTINALDADSYYWQGRCYEMLKLKDSAILRFNQSLQLDNASKTKEALKRVED